MKTAIVLLSLLLAPLSFAASLEQLRSEISAAAKNNDEPRMRAKTKEAIAAYPNSGRVFILLGDLTRGEADAHHSNPENAQMSYQLSLASYQRATELEPANVEAHRKMGEVLLQLHSPAAALTSLKKAQSLDPKQPGLGENLAQAESAIHPAKGKRTSKINKLERERRAANDFFCWKDEIPGHTLGPNPHCTFDKILLKRSSAK